jgi:hypothetical protein
MDKLVETPRVAAGIIEQFCLRLENIIFGMLENNY